MVLDEKGRCCGRKPMVYKTSRGTSRPQRFCPRCDRAYDLHENEQIDNWVWKQVDGQWVCQTNRKGEINDSTIS